MALIIVIAIVAIAATVHALVTDGYHRIPTCSEALHRYR